VLEDFKRLWEIEHKILYTCRCCYGIYHHRVQRVSSHVIKNPREM
jgi:hypothetical protein